MLPQIPVIKHNISKKTYLPDYTDGIGTSMILRSGESNPVKIAPQHFEIFSIGISMALPIGMEAQIRSLKTSTLTGLIVLNAPQTIDASDREEIKVCIFNASQESAIIRPNDPIAIMVFSLALRINWNDLTPITKKHNETSEQDNLEQVTTNKTDLNSETVDTSINLETAQSEEQTIIQIQNTMQQQSVQIEQVAIQPSELQQPTEPVQNTIQQPVQMTETVMQPSVPQQPTEPVQNTIQQPVQMTETVMQPSVPQQPTEPELNITQQATPSTQAEGYYSSSSASIEEPVAPPSILEEFEKIENNYIANQTEDNS